MSHLCRQKFWHLFSFSSDIRWWSDWCSTNMAGIFKVAKAEWDARPWLTLSLRAFFHPPLCHIQAPVTDCKSPHDLIDTWLDQSSYIYTIKLSACPCAIGVRQDLHLLWSGRALRCSSFPCSKAHLSLGSLVFLGLLVIPLLACATIRA